MDRIARAGRTDAGQGAAMAILTARDAADLFESHFAGVIGERLVVAFLAADGRLLALDVREEEAGSLFLPIRPIATRSLSVDAYGLVVAHNHASGDSRPSEADIAATRRLATACAALDITLHDHLIYAAGEWESFRRLGLL